MQVVCTVRPAWPAEVEAPSLQRQEQPCTDILISIAMTNIAYTMTRFCIDDPGCLEGKSRLKSSKG